MTAVATTVESPAQVTILPVSFRDILDAPNAAFLIHAYSASCIVPDAEPQRPLYEAMERAGILHGFAAYANGSLIGFASVICSIMPHDGHLVGTMGEMFIDLPYRGTDAEDLLLSALEQTAADAGCRCFVCLARIDSKYSKRLAQREGFHPTQTQFTKWLNGYGGSV